MIYSEAKNVCQTSASQNEQNTSNFSVKYWKEPKVKEFLPLFQGPPQWQPHQQCAAAVFYSEKSRQGLGLGGLASCGGPNVQGYLPTYKDTYNVVQK